jgi:5-methylcytosine-specific restriction endonuclease McrA
MSAKRRRALAGRADVRAAVFARDDWRCRLHGFTLAGACFGPLTPHHVVKSSQGGAYSLDNLVTLCSSHNDRLEADAGLARLAVELGLVVRRSA